MPNCRGCNQPILWAITEGGRRAPLDLAPSSDGNVLIWRVPVGTESLPAGTIAAVTLAGSTLAELVAHGVPLRTNHFMTCPVADRFRAGGGE